MVNHRADFGQRLSEALLGLVGAAIFIGVGFFLFRCAYPGWSVRHYMFSANASIMFGALHGLLACKWVKRVLAWNEEGASKGYGFFLTLILSAAFIIGLYYSRIPFPYYSEESFNPWMFGLVCGIGSAILHDHREERLRRVSRISSSLALLAFLNPLGCQFLEWMSRAGTEVVSQRMDEGDILLFSVWMPGYPLLFMAVLVAFGISALASHELLSSEQRARIRLDCADDRSRRLIEREEMAIEERRRERLKIDHGPGALAGGPERTAGK